MYFNDEKNNTSIDKELKDKTILSTLKKNIKKIIIILLVLILLIGLIFVIIGLFKNRITFKLNGDIYIKLTRGEEYVEPGYIATDKNGLDISNEVITAGEIDTSKVGLYHITYKLRNKKIQRTIRIVEPEAGKTAINLKGEETIYLNIGQKYEEPGYICIDSIDGDITDKVNVTNDIDTSKTGLYKVTYTVTNSTNITTTVNRVVIVK